MVIAFYLLAHFCYTKEAGVQAQLCTATLINAAGDTVRPSRPEANHLISHLSLPNMKMASLEQPIPTITPTSESHKEDWRRDITSDRMMKVSFIL